MCFMKFWRFKIPGKTTTLKGQIWPRPVYVRGSFIVWRHSWLRASGGNFLYIYIDNEITRVEWWLFVCAGDGVWSVWSIGQQDTSSSSSSGWRRWLDGGEEEEVKILGWTVKLRDWSSWPLTYRKRLFSESWASASTCSRLKGSCRLRKAGRSVWSKWTGTMSLNQSHSASCGWIFYYYYY